MKTKGLEKKLALNKTTISHLENREMKTIKGGTSYQWTCPYCDTMWNSCIPCYMVFTSPC